MAKKEKQGRGRPALHGMDALQKRGPDAMDERQAERLGFIDELIQSKEGRADVHHMIAKYLTLITLEMAEYYLSGEANHKSSITLNSNMRLLLSYLEKYPEDPEGVAPTVLDAMAKVTEAREKQDWSIKDD